MVRNEIINKEYNVNVIAYLWQSKQLSVNEYNILKNKYNIE